MLTFVEAVRMAFAASLASLALVAILFAWRDPARKALWLYAFLALGLALYQGLPAIPSSPPLSAPVHERLEGLLSFLLPALGYLFLVRFEAIPETLLRRGLALVSLLGAAVSLFPPEPLRPWLGPLSALLLVLLSTDFLAGLWRHGRRTRPEAPLLFLGTAVLLFAVLAELAIERQVLLVSVGAPPLLGPAFVLFSALLLVAVADEGKRLLARASTDTLTRLSNRASFVEKASHELERSARVGSSLAVAILDVDRFKSVNDRFGHPEGDRVLVAVARAIQKTVRGIDLSGRWGGEEFVLLFVDLDEEAALTAVERVRAAVGAVGPPRVPERVTVSAGVTMHHGRFETATVDTLVGRADLALYESKRAGRDRTTLAVTDPEVPESVAEFRYR